MGHAGLPEGADPVNLKRLEERVMKDEGYRGNAYLDDIAVPPTWTVGYGTTRLPGVGPVKSGDYLSPEDAKRLLRGDLFGAILDAESLFSRFHEMNSVRQEVLANMAYQLGGPRLAKFRKLVTASDRLDYQTMAEEMIDSLWYRAQSGHRGQRLVAAMRTGDWVA